MKRVLLFLLAALIFAPAALAESSEGTFIIRDRITDHPADHFQIEAVDPIVSYGVRPSAHLHMFMCAKNVTEFSTPESLIAQGTGLCSVKADTAGYWLPALLNGQGQPVQPRVMFAYYKTIPTSYRTTQPFPAGLKFVSDGSYPATSWWDCFDNKPSGKYAYPLHCATGELEGRLIMANCWDGWQLDTPNHRDHVVRPVSGACPADHPVKLPSVRLFVRYPVGAGGLDWHLASFPEHGLDIFHGDFLNGWQPGAQESLVSRCLNAGVNCNVVTSP